MSNKGTLSGLIAPPITSGQGANVGTATGTALGTLASANDGVAVGYRATVTAASSLAIGAGTIAKDQNAPGQGKALAIGALASADYQSVALGWSALAVGGGGNIAIGNSASVTGTGQGVAIGINATTPAGVAIGGSATCAGGSSVSVGTSATCAGSSSVSIGQSTTCGGGSSIAIGQAATCVGASSLTVGQGATCLGVSSVTVGQGANCGGGTSVVIGNGANSGVNGASVGYFAGRQATSTDNAFLGYQAGYAPATVSANGTTTGARQVLVGSGTGQNSATQRNDVIAVGYRALVDGDNAIAIGSGTSAGAAGAVAIGKDNAGTSATTSVANEIKLGTALHTVNVPGAIKVGGVPLASYFIGNVSGALTVAAGTSRIYNDTGRTLTITGIRASVGTAPTGAAILVDVNKNGTTLFTTQGNRPTIAISGNTSGKVTNADVTSLASGDYLTVDVDQIGSTVAGADLVVQVEVI